VFGGSQHHPPVLVGAVIFIIAIAYFVITSTNFLKNLGAGKMGAISGQLIKIEILLTIFCG
jgi:hypothetical protein